MLLLCGTSHLTVFVIPSLITIQRSDTEVVVSGVDGLSGRLLSTTAIVTIKPTEITYIVGQCTRHTCECV